jgi:hypothetical protein
MAAGNHLQISAGRTDSAKNIGYIRFGYSGTSGSNDNYIGLGFHSADDLIKIFPNRIISQLLTDIIYPLQCVIKKRGREDPRITLGGNWVMVGVYGTVTWVLNNRTSVIIAYNGTNARVNISCLNYQLGDVVMQYEFADYGVMITSDLGELVPMNFQIYDGDHFGYAGTGARITKLSGTKISIDTWYGDSRKNDYTASFTTLINNYTNAINRGADITEWQRLSL